MFDELLQLYSQKERVPDDAEFPFVRPRMDSCESPSHLIDWTDFPTKAEEIRDGGAYELTELSVVND